MASRVRRAIEAIRGFTKDHPRPFRAIAAFHERLYLVAFGLVIALVLIFQAELHGFIPWHHGYVSAHNLAIISSTTLENSFAGYALSFRETDRIRYSYFRRSPGVLVPLQRAMTLTPFSTFRSQLYASFQFMNVMNLLALWVAFCVLRRLLPTANHAMAVAIFVFGNYYIMRYRDMIAPDNLSLLGNMLIIYGAVDSVERARRWVFYALGILGSLLGWGVASLPVLCLWCFMRFVSVASWAQLDPRAWLREIPRIDAIWVFLIATVLVGGSIYYTVTVEASRNGVPADNTSIAGAVERRSDGPSLLHPIEQRIAWRAWGEDQLYRVEKSFYPYSIVQPHHVDRSRTLVLCALLLALGIAIRKWSWAQRAIALLLATSGVLWLLVLTDHARPHEYSAVTYAGIPLVLVGAAFVRFPRWTGGVLLVPVVVAFAVSNARANEHKEQNVAPYSWMADDFQAIAAQVPEGSTVYYDRGHRHILRKAPYGIGYFLSGRHITTSRRLADFVVSTNRSYSTPNLTPGNRQAYLFPARAHRANSSFLSPPPSGGGR